MGFGFGVWVSEVEFVFADPAVAVKVKLLHSANVPNSAVVLS